MTKIKYKKHDIAYLKMALEWAKVKKVTIQNTVLNCLKEKGMVNAIKKSR